MAISVVSRNKVSDAAGGFCNVSFASNSAGNTIIAIGVVDGTASSLGTPTDTIGNTYTLVQTVDNSWSVKIKVWVKYGCAASAGSNQVSMNDGFTDAGLFIFEVAGLASSAAYDKFAAQQQASTTAPDSTNTATTTNANELLIGIIGSTAAASTLPTVGTGFSNLQTTSVSFFSGGSEEKIVSATGAYNATFGLPANGDNETTAIFTFSDTAIGGAPAFIARANRPVLQAVNRGMNF